MLRSNLLGLAEITCFILFILALCSVTAVAVGNAVEARKNRSWPRLTVPARVTGKRSEAGARAKTRQRWYYVTFEVESGDSMELSVRVGDYGALAEGDTGRLTFQGSRFMSFDRG